MCDCEDPVQEKEEKKKPYPLSSKRTKQSSIRDIWLNVAIIFLLCAYLILVWKVME